MVKRTRSEIPNLYTRRIVDLEELLNNLVNNVDGAIGAAIGGMDGLLVEQHAAEPSLNLATIVAEHANLLKSTKSAYGNSLSAGNVGEVMIVAEHMLGYTKEINHEFFLTLILDPSGNFGKARLLGVQAARNIQEVVG